MYMFDILFTQPWVHLLGTVALHFLWQGVLIAIGVAILLKVIPADQSRTRYTIVMGALILLLMVPLASFIQGYGQLEPVASVAFEEFPVQTSPDAGAFFNEGEIAQAPSRGNVEPVQAPLWVQMRSWLGIGWVIGAMFMALRLGLGWVHVNRLKTRFSEPVPSELEIRFDRLVERAGIRSSVAIRQTQAFTEAVLVGWIKPAVLLPMSVVSEMSTNHIEAIMAHELAHVKRYDYILAGIQALIETILFYHPAVWWVSRQVRIEREHCCDDLAASLLNDPHGYAAALYELENHRTGFGRFALSVQDGSLLARIRRLANKPAQGRAEMYPRTGVSTMVIVAIVACSLIIGSCADFASDSVSIGEGYDLPPRLASMVAVGDRDGIVTYLHDAHNSGEEETLEWIAGVYDRSEEEVRRSLMFVLAHINTPEADQVLIQIAEADPSVEVRKGALRSITIRSEAVGQLNEDKYFRGEGGTLPASSDYSYPSMTEDQEKALASSLRRIFMDEEQSIGVRQEAYRVLEPHDEQSQLADEAIMTSTVPQFKLILIRYLNHPEKYRNEVMNIYNSAPDVTVQSNALHHLSEMGAFEMMPHMMDLLLDVSAEDADWKQLMSAAGKLNTTRSPEFFARSSMSSAIAAFYFNAPQAERTFIADQIERELAPRIERIEERINAGFESFDEREAIIEQLNRIVFLVPTVRYNSDVIHGLETPSQEKASELLAFVKDGVSPLERR